ncbi:MAG: hypothetical protein NC181_04565 [Clostridium sp.]|nr:hypothetical protein [Clostridium sp.]MCM1444552.1 hypothetical protein [Candidatus Amulumruptor caecigallinarius]
MIFLVIFLVIILIVLGIIIYIKRTFKSIFGNSNIKQIINDLELENQNTPKTLFGLESVYLPQVKKDFPDLNINELKSLAEEKIIKCLSSTSAEAEENEKIKYFINERKNKDYSLVKVHKTTLNKYQNDLSVATIDFQTSLEYVYNGKKIQTRYETEFIHVLDLEKFNSNEMIVTINCPNCGAPIKNFKETFCEYCNCGIIDIVKKIWIFNNIREF